MGFRRTAAGKSRRGKICNERIREMVATHTTVEDIKTKMLIQYGHVEWNARRQIAVSKSTNGHHRTEGKGKGRGEIRRKALITKWKRENYRKIYRHAERNEDQAVEDVVERYENDYIIE